MKTALITGGTRGIGLGISRALASEGFALAVNGMRPEQEVTECLEELRTAGFEVMYCQADVSKSEERAKLMGDVRERFGQLNVLVNNAGVAPLERADILEATEESFDRVTGINLKGPYFLTQSTARWMVEQKKADAAFRACIINISSVSATAASVNRGEYCISKAGLAMASKLWAVRLGEFEIPVYEIRAGIISTDMTAGVKAKYDQMIEEGLLLQKRWGSAEDVGKAAAMLARGDLAYSTGSVITVDGGLSVERL